MEEEEENKVGVDSIIRKDEEFAVCLNVDGLEGIIFVADFIDSDDASSIDFYLKSRLVVSISKSKFLMYQIKDVSEYYNAE